MLELLGVLDASGEVTSQGCLLSLDPSGITVMPSEVLPLVRASVLSFDDTSVIDIHVHPIRSQRCTALHLCVCVDNVTFLHLY